MQDYKVEFAEFLVTSGALSFGEFMLKSGRKSPYFLNTGGFETGKSISRLGYFYASALKEFFGEDFDVVFGPAYKGVPLAVTTVISLANDFDIDKRYSFNRKEAKDHAEKGFLVGSDIKDGDRVVMLDDVFTTGDTKVEMVELFEDYAKVEQKGVVIALDRQETNKDGENAIANFIDKLGIPVYGIICIREVLEILYNRNIGGQVYLGPKEKAKIERYLVEFGII
ncbi:orotate phosphoribosyltransferase [Patescibacteria group bacterium]|nr:orotate phosphoribosyltransferase [Patescibacteria group bacterium]